ncbi:MAG: signal peptidase I [Candidatus Dormibacteria bacterium]
MQPEYPMDPASAPDEPETTTHHKSLMRDFLEVVVFALVLYIVIQAAVQTVHVVGNSMLGTLQNNDLLIAVKAQYWISSPQRGDIVIFHPPPPGNSEADYIKRVIGLPGETIRISQGQVFINGHRLNEPYLPGAHAADLPVCRVPQGEYMVFGDNREASSDSRLFGPVKREVIEGRAMLRIWPAATMGLVTAGPTLGEDIVDPGTDISAPNLCQAVGPGR